MRYFKLSLEDIKNMFIEVDSKGFITTDTRFFDVPFEEVIRDSLDAFEIKDEPESEPKTTETMKRVFKPVYKKKIK